MLKQLKLNKDQIIKDTALFKTVRYQGIRFATPLFYCYWKKDSVQRIGVTISKKQIKFAVRRNKIKRIIKDWFRLNQFALPLGDFVFIVTRRSLHFTSTELRSTLNLLSKKLQKRCNNTT